MDFLYKNLPTLKQLQCFLAVAHERNFRLAAEKMRMTQPPLSRQIQCLEDFLGERLFIRDTHSVALTVVGKALEAEAKEVLIRLNGALADLGALSTRVRFGLTSNLDFTCIPEVVKYFNGVASDALQSSVSQPSRRLITSLIAGDLDVALIGEIAIFSDEINYQRIHRESLMVALPSSHPASKKVALRLEDVADLPLYWFRRNDNPGYYDKCQRIFELSGVILNRRLESPDSLRTLADISRGLGFALMPQSVSLSLRHGLCYKQLCPELTESLNIDVYVAWRKDERRRSVLHAVTALKHSFNKSARVLEYSCTS